MPIYRYKCADCLDEWKENHGMTESIEYCHGCNSVNIARVPTVFSNLTKKENQKKIAGDLTKEFIKNSREDLKAHRKELDKKR